MRRAKVRENRVRQVTVEDLGAPLLPIGEEPGQLVHHVVLGHRLEQADARWWGAGPSVEGDDQDLATLERGVQGEQEADREGDRAQPGAASNQSEEPCQAGCGHDVAEPDRQHGRAGKVEGRLEAVDGGADVITKAVKDEPEAEDKPAQPQHEQDDDDQRGKSSQRALPGVGRARPQSQRTPQAPARTNHPPRRTVARRRRPRYDDALEEVVEDVGDDRNPDQDLGQPQHEGHSTTSEATRRPGRSMITNAGTGTRTLTPLRAGDFKSPTSTYFVIPARATL